MYSGYHQFGLLGLAQYCAKENCLVPFRKAFEKHDPAELEQFLFARQVNVDRDHHYDDHIGAKNPMPHFTYRPLDSNQRLAVGKNEAMRQNGRTTPTKSPAQQDRWRTPSDHPPLTSVMLQGVIGHQVCSIVRQDSNVQQPKAGIDIVPLLFISRSYCIRIKIRFIIHKKG